MLLALRLEPTCSRFFLKGKMDEIQRIYNNQPGEFSAYSIVLLTRKYYMHLTTVFR